MCPQINLQCTTVTVPSFKLCPPRTMSQTDTSASSSSESLPYNFQSVLDAALETYEKKTKTKLFIHPLATQLQSCDSPTVILSVLQNLTQQFDRCRSSVEIL